GATDPRAPCDRSPNPAPRPPAHAVGSVFSDQNQILAAGGCATPEVLQAPARGHRGFSPAARLSHELRQSRHVANSRQQWPVTVSRVHDWLPWPAARRDDGKRPMLYSVRWPRNSPAPRPAVRLQGSYPEGRMHAPALVRTGPGPAALAGD